MDSEADGRRGALIAHGAEGCTGCWTCVRCCPVSAIRVSGECAEIVQEKCVACGQCVNECARGGITVRDDTPRVRELLRTHRHVVALLASEFIAALYPMTVVQTERSLEVMGFDSVETTLLGEELVAQAYEQLHAREGSVPSLRSTCPVAIDFVRKYHPAFVQALAPIVPPYVAQARLIRAVYPHEVAIVYVSPCYARKDEALDPSFDGAIDVAIDFTELKRLILEERPLVPGGTMASPAPSRPTALKEISLTDGFPRQTLVSRNLTDASVHVVRGVREIDRLLTAIGAGEAGPLVIDMLNCEGCIDGPAVNPGLSLFAKRNVEAAARRAPSTTQVSTRAMLAMLPAVDIIRSFVAEPVAVPVPDDAAIDAVLAEGGFTGETVLDCGACGWPTCRAHAAAIYNAESSWDLCLPLQRRLMREHAASLAETQTLDPVTGLWNTRSFGDRLAVEIARLNRYGSPVCVALVDVDGLGEIRRSTDGSEADGMLRAMAERFSACLRATDVLARWTGDRFAIALSGVNKTEAFAASEKLRECASSMKPPGDASGYTQGVKVAVSIGVASASRGSDARAVLECADAALLEAIHAGGDQVRLAPG